MPPEASLPQPAHRFADPRQRRIHERLLRLVGPGPAAFFRDACAISDSGMLSSTHLVGHLMREVESALRDVLEPEANRAKRLSRRNRRRLFNWRTRAWSWITGKIHEPGDGQHREIIIAVLRGLGIEKQDHLAKAWLKVKRIDRLAHRAGLGLPRPADEEFRMWWTTIQGVFDAVLTRFEERFVAVFELLDSFLAKAQPTKADATEFAKRVPATTVTYQYFFTRIETPAWLRVLRKSIVFRHPPEAEADETGAIRIAPWPQSQYLVRMADQEPQIVGDIIDGISTRNVYVAGDFVEAALKMPVAQAVRIARKAEHWLAQPYGSLLPDKLGRLAAYLAHGGEVDLALVVAGQLLAVESQQRPTSTEGQDQSTFRFPPEPKPKVAEHTYEEILRRDIPALGTAAPDRTIALLCETLAEAVRCSLSDSWDDAGQSLDLSEIWRKSVARPDAYNVHDLKNMLVTAVANTVRQSAEADLASLPVLTRQVESYRWPVFRRIALYVLQTFPEAGRALVAERLTDRALLLRASVNPEYDELLGECFAHLSDTEQQAVLAAVDEGPDLRHDRFADATDQQRAHYIDAWKRDRVALCADDLPPAWRTRFDDWVGRLGDPVGHDLAERLARRSRSTSIITREDLAAMSADEIVEFLVNWEPPEGIDAPTLGDLRGVLEDVVGSDPARFAEAAERFTAVDPTYVAGLMSGFRRAVADGTAFEWEGVLKLGRWAVRQAREIPGRGDERGHFGGPDPNWGWARQVIAMLLDSGFGRPTSEIPFDLRTLAWDVLEPLTDDPNPTADEDRNGGSDLYTSSINTVRGCAMHAVISYALWVRRHLDDAGGNGSAGFDAILEVRRVLERHLDVNIDTSLTVRAVYGRHLYPLAYLDEAWLQRSLDLIFPLQDNLLALRDAAWSTYLVWGRLTKPTFVIAGREYGRAVDSLSPDDVPSDGRQDPRSMLAEHLMVLYWWGEISLEDRLLERFFDRAASAHRGRALGYLGQILGDQESEIASELRDRLTSLWAKRLEAAAESPEAYGKDLAAFGSWFRSGQFDDSWALEQLAAALSVHPRTDLGHDVLKRVAAMSGAAPLTAVRCARLMCHGDIEGWEIPMWKSSLNQILANAISGADVEAQDEGRSLISYLVSRGYINFRDAAGGQ